MRGHTVECNGSKWDTFEDIVSFHNPLPGGHTGSSIQIFTGNFSNLLLFHRILAYSGGFEFSGGRQMAGPIVWCECQVPKGFAFSGPHDQWNMGYLWDSLLMTHSLAVIEQGKGMTGANHLAWNCESTSTYNFERVPTTHQWIQGCISSQALPTPKNNGPPEVLSYGTHLQPGSLYRAQLYERVGESIGQLTLGPPAASNWFDVKASTSLTVQQGQSATTTVTLIASSAFLGQTVSFNCSGLPTGATSSFVPGSLTGSGSTQLTITTRSATPPGVYTVGVTGTGTFPLFSGGSQTVKRTSFLKLTVTKAPPSGGGGGGGGPPPGPLVYEAEALTVDGATTGEVRTTLTESALSNHQAVQFFAIRVGDFLRFVLPNVPAGNYDVRIGTKEYRPRSIVQTCAGNMGATLVNVGAPMDQYSNTTAYVEMDLGNWMSFGSGNKEFEFDVVGKNPSSSGYSFVIDYIKLIPQ